MRGKVRPYLYKIPPYPKISPIWLKLARLCVREQVLLARWASTTLVGLAGSQLTRLSRVTQASRGCDTLTTQNHHHWHYHQLSWLEALFLFRKIHLTM